MIYLAPIRGTTDRIFRSVFSAYFRGVDAAVAPFISLGQKMKPDDKLLREFYPEKNTGIPTIPQVMSSDPANFTILANALYDIGCGTVNWNLGCPFPMVVKRGRGAGMLCYPDRVESFLEKAMPAVKPKVSIKLRTGLTRPDEVLRLIPVFNGFPLEELIIHPRTGVQMYEGDVDLEMFGECISIARHRVVYNGDIDSPEKLRMLSKRFKTVKRWMIGRGLIADPFLAEKIKFNIEKPYPEKIKIMRAFHDHLFSEYSKVLSGPAHITDKMQEIWNFMVNFFEKGQRTRIRRKINMTHHRDNYLQVIDRIFNETL